jgi:hemin uptake protein HemP
MSQPEHQEKPAPPPQTQPALPVIAAEQLFKGEREIFIDHAGERYRLRITRRGKLILQK